jgi:hypothetical protein
MIGAKLGSPVNQGFVLDREKEHACCAEYQHDQAIGQKFGNSAHAGALERSAQGGRNNQRNEECERECLSD